MKPNEPKVYEQGEYTLITRYWYSELVRRPFYSCLLKRNGKVVFHIADANKEFTLKEMVNMWRAKQL